MFEIGRVCYKTAGRDSNNVCVVVQVVDTKYVIIDGNVRRKKVNVNHLEPTNTIISLTSGADTHAVHKALQEQGFAIVKKGTARPKKDKPVQVRKTKVKPTETVKKAPAKKVSVKKAAK